jgi:ATP-dependent DNA helicase RecG
VTVANEGKVTHARLVSMTTTHSRDLSLALASLVREGFLESNGTGRGTFYFFPGEPPNSDDTSSNLNYESDAVREERNPSSDHLPVKSDHLPSSSDHLPIQSDHWAELVAIAEPVRGRGKVPTKDITQEVIMNLCRDQFLTQKQLAELLGRSTHTLRNSYLKSMLQDNQLELRYPDKPTHPEQAYRTKA